LSLEEAYRSTFYVLIVIAYIFIMCSQVGAIAHLYNRVDLVAGYDFAAQSIQALSVASILGRFLGGWLVNKISTASFALGNLCLQGLGLLLISFADNGAFSIFAALIFGLSVGNLLMTLPLWLAEVFPAGVYPRLFARANAFSVLGLAVGPFTIGALFDLTDGYHIPYLFALFVSLLAFFVMLAAVKQNPAISR
jgi:MFS family permease